jgi:hypothetical protein
VNIADVTDLLSEKVQFDVILWVSVTIIVDKKI